MATRNPVLISTPPQLADLRAHRAVIRARAAGGQAALDGFKLEDNPYHRTRESQLHTEWESMYLRVRRDIRAAQLAAD